MANHKKPKPATRKTPVLQETKPDIPGRYKKGQSGSPERKWKKGQSGNPNGRPTGRKNLQTIVRTFLDVEVDIGILGGKMADGLRQLLGDDAIKRLSIRDLLILRQVSKGLNEGQLASTDYILKAAGEFKEELSILLQQDFTDDEATRVLERIAQRRRDGGMKHGGQ